MSNAPRKTPFAVGERVGMWVVAEVLPVFNERADRFYLAIPDCCGQPARMAGNTLAKARSPSGCNKKGWCMACSTRMRNELGMDKPLPVREGYVPPVAVFKPGPKPQVETAPVVNPVPLFLCQPHPAGLRRDVWGHPG